MVEPALVYELFALCAASLRALDGLPSTVAISVNKRSTAAMASRRAAGRQAIQDVGRGAASREGDRGYENPVVVSLTNSGDGVKTGTCDKETWVLFRHGRYLGGPAALGKKGAGFVRFTQATIGIGGGMPCAIIPTEGVRSVVITSETPAWRANSRMWPQKVCHLRCGSMPTPTITSRDSAGSSLR